MHNGIPVRYGKPTRRKGSKLPIIMVIIIIILALLAGIYFVHGIFLNNSKEETQETVNTQQTEVVTEEKSVEQQAEDKVPVVEEPKAETEDVSETDEQPTEPETKPEEQPVVTPEPETPAVTPDSETPVVTQPETVPETAPTAPGVIETVPEPNFETIQ